MKPMEMRPEPNLLGQVVAVWLLGVGLSTVAAGEAATGQAALGRFEFSQVEMAVTVKIALYSADSDAATAAAKEAFSRIEALNGILSDYDPESELRRLCDTAGTGKAVHVSPELWKVLEHAQRVSQQSEGAFDVTVGPVVRLWRRARRQNELPSPQALRQAEELVGYKFLRLDAEHQAVELLEERDGDRPGRDRQGLCDGRGPGARSSGMASRGPWWKRAATCGWAIRRRTVPAGGSASRRWTIRRASR